MDARANRRWLRTAGWVLGAALTLGAAALAWRGADFSPLASARAGWLVLLGVLVAGNLLLTGLLFWAVTLSFDAQPPVPVGRMVQLIAGSALLNYLPLRPGLVGRAAYLKMRHGLPLHQSVLILGVVLALGALVLGVPLLAVLLATPTAQDQAGMAVLVGLLLLTPLTGPLARRMLRRPIVGSWWWLPLRVLDLLVGAVRLWAAFAALGETITISQAIAAGAAGMFISQLGVTPNGLGLREWVIAGAAALVAPLHAPVGAAAALLDRAVELLVVLPLGGIALAQLGMNAKQPPQQRNDAHVS